MTDSPRLPKGVWINTSLAVVVAAGGAGAWALLGSSGSGRSAAGRTAAVQRGDVTAEVSASGNITLPTQLDLAFTASGTVTEVDVKPGDAVKAGQVLAKIDTADAKQQLASAQAQLTTAQAQLTKLQQGQTPQQAALSRQQLKSAGDSLASAKTSYSDTQNSLALDASNLASAVTAAQQTLTTDTDAKADAATIARDQAALTQAQNAQKTGSQKDTQSLHQAQSSMTQAQNSYNTAVDQQAVSAAPATPDQIASADQSVLNAQNAVASAQKGVAGTVITAPSAGTVLSVGGSVGDTVSAGTSSTAAASSSGGSGGTSGSSGSAASGSSSGSSSSSSSGGTKSGSSFVVLGDMAGLTVRAEFAETDAAKLKAGEDAQVSINAIPGSALTATVQSVDPTSTVVSNVVEYGVTLQFTAGQQDLAALKMGQTASVSVTTDSVTNVLYVPSSAVTSFGGQSFVTVVDGRTQAQTQTPVQVGVVGDTSTEITSGVTEGEQILLSSRTTSTSTTGTRGGTGGFGGGAGGLGGGAAGGGGRFGG